MKVSILIPIYNEFLTLPLVLQRVLDAPLRIGSAIVVWKSGQIALHCKVDLIVVLLLFPALGASPVLRALRGRPAYSQFRQSVP
jgi:hypothetical protein